MSDPSQGIREEADAEIRQIHDYYTTRDKNPLINGDSEKVRNFLLKW